MDKNSILACNIIVLVVAIIQIIAGGMAIKLGSDLSNNYSFKYSSVFTAEANYYIVAGVFSLLMAGYSIFMGFNSNVSPLLTNSAFLNTLLLLCFQFSMAIYSLITANVMSQQSDSFQNYSKNQCSCVTLNNLMIAVAILSWLLSCPCLFLQLDWRWGQWKDIVVDEEQPSLTQPPAIPDEKANSNLRDSLR